MMLLPNMNYANLKESYLFHHISEKINAYLAAHPGAHLYRMGIGDVSLPLCDAVIHALRQAVEDQSHRESFHGYMPECGAAFLRETIASFYAQRGISLSPDEVFISSGASDELGDLLDLFDVSNRAVIMEPAYPAYVDASVMAGRQILYLHAAPGNDFLPMPDAQTEGELVYLCSPNNPTGAAYTREQLQAWVSWANHHQAVILFDAAYEAFIEEALPHSIFEIPGAKTCAIEVCSLSKTAGFTGTRLGYTVIPASLERQGMNLNRMWVRNRTTRTNGVSYILQRGGAAVFTPEGQEQIHRNIGIYKKNGQVLMQALSQAGVRYWGGKNAPYLWMQCPGRMNSWDFFDLLLYEIQVVGTPGSGFGEGGEGYFRFSTFGDPADTVEAAQRIVALLEKKMS